MTTSREGHVETFVMVPLREGVRDGWTLPVLRLGSAMWKECNANAPGEETN